MWPILASFFLALCVILDRCIWWFRAHPNEPFLATLADGMTHANTSMLAAMQLKATHLIEKADARMWVLSTMITLAPLLGLFGTVVGIMQSFSFR